MGVCIRLYPDTLKDPTKMDPPPQYEPITTLGKLGDYWGFHFLDPLGGLGTGRA